MWYAVETAFIKGTQYKSRLLFGPDADPNYEGAQPGTCLCGHDEEPYNKAQSFMDGEIEVHVDWFQTKEQAVQFANGSLCYVIHKETWYDAGTRSIRSRFLRWEAVPSLGARLPFRGYYEHHYRGGKDKMVNSLLRALLASENGKGKEVIYNYLKTVGMDRITADEAIRRLKKAI